MKLFGKEPVDVVTKLSIINQKTNEKFRVYETSTCPLLAIGQKESGIIRANELISDGDYRLTFVIESSGKRIATKIKSAKIKGNKVIIK